jgi:hypothetical protein
VRTTIIVIAILLCFSYRLTAQTRTIYGRVIDEDLDTLPYVLIHSADGLLLGNTDIGGRFKIEVPRNIQTLVFDYIGLEWTLIKLNADCDTVEVVMMGSATYDFTSARKIDRLRLRRFNKLPELHLQAYEKGLFFKESACYSQEFMPEKPALDSIEKVDAIEEKQNKLTFEKFNVGDTVKIPFSGDYRADGADRTTLHYYSIFASMRNYKYTVNTL